DAAGGSGFYRNRGAYKYEPRLLDLLLKTCIKAPGALLLPENIAISCFRWIYRPGQAHLGEPFGILMIVEQLLMGSAVMMATQQRCILQLCLSTRFPWNYMVSLAPSGRNRASRDNATTVTSMECSTNCPWKKPL